MRTHGRAGEFRDPRDQRVHLVEVGGPRFDNGTGCCEVYVGFRAESCAGIEIHCYLCLPGLQGCVDLVIVATTGICTTY